MQKRDKKHVTALKSLGGKLRAARLSPEQRHEIAKSGALARWGEPAIRTDKMGTIRFGDVEIECAVLVTDGQVIRVLSMTGLMKALGIRDGGTTTGLPRFLGPSSMSHLISSEMVTAIENPILFSFKTGTTVTRAKGVPANTLNDICWLWIKARTSGLISHPKHIQISDHAQMLMQSISNVGIDSLVDEATGYQKYRDNSALQALLDRYLAKELGAWAKRFPDTFYQELFRLRGWTWKGMSVPRPGVVAYYTKDLIYGRMTPGLIEELERKLPKSNRGPKKRLHCGLSPDVGHPELAKHIAQVVMAMRMSDTWESFMGHMDRLLPRFEDTLKLPVMADRTDESEASDGEAGNHE